MVDDYRHGYVSLYLRDTLESTGVQIMCLTHKHCIAILRACEVDVARTQKEHAGLNKRLVRFWPYYKTFLEHFRACCAFEAGQGRLNTRTCMSACRGAAYCRQLEELLLPVFPTQSPLSLQTFAPMFQAITEGNISYHAMLGIQKTLDTISDLGHFAKP